jgi:hypothetical protein
LIFLSLLTDCAIFVLGQHEYGVLSIAAFGSGRPTASDDLLALAHGNVAGFAIGWVPSWVYPIWMVLAGTLVLVGARWAQPGRWTATIVATLYLAYRAAGYLLFSGGEIPALVYTSNAVGCRCGARSGGTMALAPDCGRRRAAASVVWQRCGRWLSHVNARLRPGNGLRRRCSVMAARRQVAGCIRRAMPSTRSGLIASASVGR